jgi:ferric-dicitrate binding protein FerR (iron transport regulator)
MIIDLEIIKNTNGDLSDEEEALLQEWLAESETHRQLYEKIHTDSPYYLPEKQFNTWREDYNTKLSQLEKKRKKIVRIWIASGIAASVAIILGIQFLFSTPAEDKRVAQDIVSNPNKQDILLTTASGEVLEWENIEASDTLYIDGIATTKQAYALSYIPAKQQDVSAKEEEEVINRIYVPRGKEFQLELSDGTKVWLNSDTELQFPALFVGKERRLTLKGEAYFDVAKNEEMPFVLSIEGAEIKVFGTQFNVNTRKIEKQSTTLIEGSISITQDGEPEKILHPGETAEINLLSGEMKVLNADTRIYTAWRYKGYLFENESLENVLEELALWYDVEIVYEDEQVKKERFSGWLQRKDEIMSILRPIEKTSYLHFRLEQNKVIVKQSTNYN